MRPVHPTRIDKPQQGQEREELWLSLPIILSPNLVHARGRGRQHVALRPISLREVTADRSPRGSGTVVTVIDLLARGLEDVQIDVRPVRLIVALSDQQSCTSANKERKDLSLLRPSRAR